MPLRRLLSVLQSLWSSSQTSTASSPDESDEASSPAVAPPLPEEGGSNRGRRATPGPDDCAKVRSDLYVGSEFAAMSEEGIAKREIDHVLTLATEHEATTHFAPLYDGLNEQSEFDAAVEVARDLLQQDGCVLIHCAAGVSRAPTVAATALAAEDDMTFQQALAEVQSARRVADPNQMLRDHAETYLREQTR